MCFLAPRARDRQRELSWPGKVGTNLTPTLGHGPRRINQAAEAGAVSRDVIRVMTALD